MTTTFPTSLDSFSNPSSSDTLGGSTVKHSNQHINVNDAIAALQAKVGADSSAVATSLDYLLRHISASWLPASQNSTTFASVTNSSLTNGRVPVAGTAGLMGDFSTLTYASGTGLVADQLTSSGLTSGRITTAGTAGKLQDFAGLAIVGTPSATAPSTGTNGPGLLSGIVVQGADGTGQIFTPVSFGNGSATTSGLLGFTCQGTAAAPGATASGDIVEIGFRGYDSASFTNDQAALRLRATATWSASSRPTQVQVVTTPSGSTTAAVIGIFDQNGVLNMGSNANGSALYAASGLSPRVQVQGSSQNAASYGQIAWLANSNAGSHIFGKSRSSTIGTPSVVTSGDTLGTIAFEADDGTDLNRAVAIIATVTGTVGNNQTPGQLVIQTGTNASPSVMTTALTIDNAQLCTFAKSIAVSGTTDSTSKTTGADTNAGGAGIAKNVIVGQGVHGGVTSTATAAGTTTLTNASTGVQIFTGSTTQTVQLPAANLFGAGVAVQYVLINRSSGNVSWQRAGSDTINGATSTVAVSSNTISIIYSDGVSAWFTK